MHAKPVSDRERIFSDSLQPDYGSLWLIDDENLFLILPHLASQSVTIHYQSSDNLYTSPKLCRGRCGPAFCAQSHPLLWAALESLGVLRTTDCTQNPSGTENGAERTPGRLAPSRPGMNPRPGYAYMASIPADKHITYGLDHPADLSASKISRGEAPSTPLHPLFDLRQHVRQVNQGVPV